MGEDVKVDAVAVKPGYKSTEFWLSFVAVVAGFVLASGVIVEGSTAAVVVGGIVTVLGALGYTSGRTSVKVAEEIKRANDSKLAGLVALAKEKIVALKESTRKAEVDLEAVKVTSSPTPAVGMHAVRTPSVGTPSVGTPTVGTPTVWTPAVGTPATDNPTALGS